MIPANSSKRMFDETKLMIVSPEQVAHTRFGQIGDHLKKGDLLVVNSSSTLPSSFFGRDQKSGAQVELRLASFRGEIPSDLSHWMAILFGEGDWSVPTESRGPPPRLIQGSRIEIGPDLVAIVTEVDSRFPRLVQIRFESKHLVRKLYELGRPIQYSYLEEELHVWDQQTLFCGPPISVEPPSAAFPMNWGIFLDLRRRGVEVATILHSAGISSSGDSALDSVLPLSEYFEISSLAQSQIERAKRNGHRVIALGTTVVRALESAYRGEAGFLSKGYTRLKLGPQSRLQVTDALITGMHAEGTSHAELMKAFCGSKRLAEVEAEAEREGYRSHEFGDLTFLTSQRGGDFYRIAGSKRS